MPRQEPARTSERVYRTFAGTVAAVAAAAVAAGVVPAQAQEDPIDLTALVQMAQAVSVAAQQHEERLTQAEAQLAAAEAAWEEVRGTATEEASAAIGAAVAEAAGGRRLRAAADWVGRWTRQPPGQRERDAKAAVDEARRTVGRVGANLDLLTAEHEQLTTLIAELAAAQQAGHDAYNQARQAERDAIMAALTANVEEGDDYTPPEGVEGVEKWRGLVERWFPERLVEEAMKIMACESGGNPEAVNPTSDATGLFQFLATTWEWVSKEAGVEGADRKNPVANVKAAAWLVSYSERTNHPQGRWGHWECRHVVYDR